MCFHFVSEAEFKKSTENFKIFKLKYQKEKVDSAYFITPMMKEPSYVNLNDYDIRWNQETGDITAIVHKRCGPVLF